MSKELITASEYARRHGMTRAWINRMCNAERIEGARKIGPVWAIPEDAVIKALPPTLMRPGRPLRTLEIPRSPRKK